jgi:phosphatidylserine/phosphatidylglycerophosphate/cardiolipin synthase-like enzyme
MLAMALSSLSALDRYKATPFPPGYPEAARTFYSPVDDVHAALTALLQSTSKSLVIAMYGYDDDQLNQVIQQQLNSDTVYVQMSLDSSQAAGGHERELLANLAKWENQKVGNSIAIGKSEKGAIMHLKLVIIDGLDVLTGSTNWSGGGETRQDNQLTVIRDALVAAEARARVDIIHDTMLKQMAAVTRGGTDAVSPGTPATPTPG